MKSPSITQKGTTAKYTVEREAWEEAVKFYGKMHHKTHSILKLNRTFEINTSGIQSTFNHQNFTFKG